MALKVHTVNRNMLNSKSLVSRESHGNDNSQANRSRRDCPLDKDELGNHTWAFLHTMVAYYPDRPTEEQKRRMCLFFEIFSEFYPCEACAAHFREMLRTSPPSVSNQDSLSMWLCWIHNRVNKRLGKPVFDCSKVNERWRDGWADGSCN